MNVNQKVLALMVALAAGVAGAAGTTAGTVINNQATATYTDPTTNNPVVTPAVSNIVSTTVTPVPSFTVLSTIGSLNDTGGQNNPVAGYDRTGVLPGSQQVFAYTVKNTGNTPVTVNMTTQLRTDNAVTGVAYYLDVNGNGTLDAGDTLLTDTNGDTTVDTASIAPDASVKLLQVYTVPTTAVGGTYYGADPVGNAKYDANYAPGNATPTTTSTTTVVGSDTDNFNRVLIYTPSVTSGSIDDNGPGGTTPTTPPATGTTDGVTAPSSKPTPGGPNPAYADPTNPATVIAVIANAQYAYPLADAEKVTDDKVTFINSVTNGGTATDSFFLYPPATLPTGATGVSYLDSAGNPLPLVTNPADGKTYPQLTNVAPGTTVNFRVVVTYLDTDGTTPPPGTITINVPIDSASDSDAAANTTATDVIYAPVLQFGDSTPGTLGTSPTPVPNMLVRPRTVDPTTQVITDSPTGLSSTDNTDRTAIFPMDLANLGGYAETYKLVGSVSVPVTGGGAPVTVAVKYYTGSGGNPTTLLAVDGSGNYISPTVTPGTEQLVYAVIDIPANAAATFTNGTTAPLVVLQQATGSTSGIIRNDNNDNISVAATGGANPSKSVDKATAKPGEDLTYTLVGKNNFNTPLLNYVIKEADGTGTGTGASTSPKANIFANSVFKTVGVTVTGATGTVLYRFNGATGTTPFGWQASATPTIAANLVTSVEVGLDTNADGVITGADSLPVGGQLTETLVMILK